jgi:large subunit ribosomal protein L30
VSELKVTQIKSGIGEKPAARKTLQALGLRKVGDQVAHADRPEIRGMVHAVRHLVEVEEVK